MRLKDDDWDAVLDANLRGAFATIRAASRGMMKRRWGRIINITSVVGITGQQGASELRGEQGGAHRPHEVGGEGARVTQHSRERHCAGLHRDRHDGSDDTPMRAPSLARRFPWARLGTPGDIAGVCAFLASEHASYITGQVFVVDGGLVM